MSLSEQNNNIKTLAMYVKELLVIYTYNHDLNEVCCVGRVEIQIEI